MSRFSIGISLACLALSTALSVPAAASAIRIALNADIRSVNPGVNRDDNSDAVTLHMVEGLVAYGDDAQVKPLLAETVALSADGLTYTFTLRRNVTFHNGAPLTAEDVTWNWARYMDPKTEWRCRSEFDGQGRAKVVQVTAVDAHTVTFTLDTPSALFLANLARTDCGMTGILHKASVKADGSFDKPIGTGPFQFAEWKRAEYIRLVRFGGYASLTGPADGYTGGKHPLVDELRFLVIPDSATAKTALLRGDIDLIPDVPNSEIRDLEGNPKLDISIISNMGLVGLLFQTRDPLLKDVRIRQAIAAAIDTPELVAAVTNGLGKPNNSIVPIMSGYYGEVQAKAHRYNPAMAKKLLAEAGYKGEPIALLANKRYPQSFATAVIAQQMLQSIGLNVTIEVLEWATQLDRYSKGNYQMQAFPYSARFDPALSYEAITGPKDTQPRKLWDNPEVQAILDQSMVVSDRAQRQALFDDLHKRFLADVPMLMLYNAIDAGIFSKRLKGYHSTVLSKPRLWEVSIAE